METKKMNTTKKTVTQKRVDAQKLLEAARMGDAAAQYNLGWCYLTGDGTRKNKAMAIKLFRKAAEQGHAKAEQMLNKLSTTATKGNHP